MKNDDKCTPQYTDDGQYYTNTSKANYTFFSPKRNCGKDSYEF